MSQYTVGVKTFTATEALEPFRRVKLTSASGTAVEYADQSDSSAYIGVTLSAAAITTQVPVALKGEHRTFKVEAADTFSVGATLYAADHGKVSDTSSGNTIGTALEACTTANDIVECLLDNASASAPGASSIGVYSDTAGGVPFVIKATCTAAGAEDETVIASFPRKALVVGAYMLARDTNAANVTLKNATNPFTAATAKGGTDDAYVPFTTIIAEYDEIAAEAAVVATFSGAGSVDVILVCVAIA